MFIEYSSTEKWGIPQEAYTVAKNSSLGFYGNCLSVETKDATPPTPQSENISLNVNNIHSMIPEDQQYNYTMMQYGRHFTAATNALNAIFSKLQSTQKTLILLY